MGERYVPQGRLSDWREENAPEVCPLLGHADYIPVVDHDHVTGKIRGVVSSEGNALLGKIENFHRSRCVAGTKSLPEVLRAMADYLEQEQGPFHPKGLRQVTKRFARTTKREQIVMLREQGATEAEIAACKNSQSRAKLLRKLLKDNK